MGWTKQLVFPAVLAGGVALTWLMVARGYHPGVVLNVVTLAVFVLVAVLEYLLPQRSDWRKSDGQVLNDLGHTWLSTGVGALLGNLTLGFVVPVVVDGLWGGATWWPSDWPFLLQIVVVFLLADLGRYVQHRMHHEIPFLWRFHALHHSVERMSVFKTSRSHVVERYFQAVAMFGLLMLLGCPLEVMIWYIIPNSVLGMLDHSNLVADLGRVEWVIMGPAAHWIHHSAAPEDLNVNYGSALVLWDQVFGTYRDPTRVPLPEVVGIEDDPVPRDFVGQYLSPFFWSRYTSGR